jgi:hypothetical protein
VAPIHGVTLLTGCFWVPGVGPRRTGKPRVLYTEP